ncbi:type II toxin-antitoxin system RelE/ParE family toxin [Candidatus Peregrinibacteria bacterium]|nr:type II toxin-antitoxin system RelE/ParE family toxin [Candidatus Peregrinibacteria bacterium]MBI3816119.1 type II toxin-antitoxin system RelE/ParE family toxin [Candidatus Peregrinibacteria bacterium]
MKTYRVVVVKRAQKEAQRLPKRDQERIAEVITSLQFDPFRGKQLYGDHEGRWSLRVWPYRIVYTIEKKIVTVTIVRIGHRKDVYR